MLGHCILLSPFSKRISPPRKEDIWELSGAGLFPSKKNDFSSKQGMRKAPPSDLFPLPVLTSEDRAGEGGLGESML